MDAEPTQASTLPHLGQAMSLQNLSFSTPGPRHTTHSVTFRTNSSCFRIVVWSLVPLECWLLNRLICYQVCGLLAAWREPEKSFLFPFLLSMPGTAITHTIQQQLDTNRTI